MQDQGIGNTADSTCPDRYRPTSSVALLESRLRTFAGTFATRHLHLHSVHCPRTVTAVAWINCTGRTIAMSDKDERESRRRLRETSKEAEDLAVTKPPATKTSSVMVASETAKGLKETALPMTVPLAQKDVVESLLRKASEKSVTDQLAKQKAAPEGGIGPQTIQHGELGSSHEAGAATGAPAKPAKPDLRLKQLKISFKPKRPFDRLKEAGGDEHTDFVIGMREVFGEVGRVLHEN
eukprot:1661517-Rhodomonas_salina.1